MSLETQWTNLGEVAMIKTSLRWWLENIGLAESPDMATALEELAAEMRQPKDEKWAATEQH